MRTPRFVWPSLLVLAIADCGDKVPESEAAKKLGNAPKEIIYKAATDAAQAIKQGSGRTSDAGAKN